MGVVIEDCRTMTDTFDRRRSTMLALASVVCLTLLFTVQDAVRHRIAGGPIQWWRLLAVNALDWVVWALLLPFIVGVGRRIRLDGGGRRLLRLGGWLLLAIAFCATQAVLTGLVIRFTNPELFGVAPPPGVAQRPLGPFLVMWAASTSTFNLLIFGMTAGAFHALLYARDLRERQLRDTELQARLARAELNVLRMQLQPHFLFNTLHTVSSLMVTDVPTAQRVVSALGDLLRSSLDHTASQEIPLHDEVAFVQRYLEIQRARFRHRLSVQLDFTEEISDALVPSLVLQPLVENAIRHGIEPQADGGRVWVRGQRNGGAVVLSVANEGAPNDNGLARRTSESPGVGLTNVAARLAQLYGPSHRFRAEWVGIGNGGPRFVVEIEFPYHTERDLFPTAADAGARSR
jgi:two-component system, LytTR family, sensor kinase